MDTHAYPTFTRQRQVDKRTIIRILKLLRKVLKRPLAGLLEVQPFVQSLFKDGLNVACDVNQRCQDPRCPCLFPPLRLYRMPSRALSLARLLVYRSYAPRVKRAYHAGQQMHRASPKNE